MPTQESARTNEVDLANTPIAALLADFPQLEPVLNAFGLDTCCGGHFSPARAAAEHGFEPAPLLQALREALAR